MHIAYTKYWKVLVILILGLVLVWVVSQIVFKNKTHCESALKSGVVNSKNDLSAKGVVFPENFDEKYLDAYYEAYLKQQCE